MSGLLFAVVTFLLLAGQKTALAKNIPEIASGNTDCVATDALRHRLPTYGEVVGPKPNCDVVLFY